MSDAVEDNLARAQTLGDQALADSPQNPIAHFAKAELLRARHRCGAAISEYETVLAFDRNSAWAIAAIGRCKIYLGQLDEAVPLIEQAIRLAPQAPEVGVWYFRLGQARLLQSRIAEAIPLLERARGLSPSFPWVLKWLAVAYAFSGDRHAAETALADARQPSGRIAPLTIAGERAGAEYFSVPATRALFESTYLAGLRKAGVPER
jgi:tetratricopeptide (TPR) repeat protein